MLARKRSHSDNGEPVVVPFFQKIIRGFLKEGVFRNWRNAMITTSVMAMAKKLVDENPNLMVIALGYNNQNAPKLFARTLDKPARTFVSLLPDHECCELMLSGWVSNIRTTCEPINAIFAEIYGDCEQMLRNAFDNPSLTPEKKLAIRANPQQVLQAQACAAIKIRVLEEVINRLHE